MSPGARVAAVVVAHNGGNELQACLRSLLGQTVRGLEVTVVDNASTDGSIERAEASLGTRVRFIRRPVNGGYAAGANTGWRATDAPLVVILNQDLTFDKDCLEQMRRVLVAEGREAMVSPKIVLMSDPTRVNAIGNDVHLSGVASCHGLGTPAEDWHGVVEVAAISGAAFMARRTLLEDLDGLEEAYFMYMEDVDLSLRARLAEAACLVACDAVATHRWSLSLTPEKFGLLERNRRIMWRSLFGREGPRIQVALLQAEALGWLYAAMRGRAHVVAKFRGARAPRRVARVRVRAGATRRLARELSTSLPYSTVMPGMRAVAFAGGIVDRAVGRIAGVAREGHDNGHRGIQRAD